MSDEASNVPSDAPTLDPASHHLHAPVPIAILPKHRTWRQTFAYHFPDPVTRFVFLVALGLAFVLSGLWSAYIIQGRWLEQINNPSTLVTRERLESIPMIEVLAFSYPSSYFGNNITANTVFHKIQGYQDSYGESPALSPDVFQCNDVYFFSPDAICEPFINGVPVFPATEGPDAIVPAPYTLAQWPVQYKSRGNALELRIHIMLNTTAALRSGRKTLDYNRPYLDVFLIKGSQVVAMKNLLATLPPGSLPTTDQLMAFSDELPRSTSVKMNHVHELNLGIVKNVNVAGDVTFEWTLTPNNDLEFSPDQIEFFWESLLYSIGNGTETPEVTRMLELRNLSDIVYFPASVFIAPSSFDVTVVAQKVNYNYLNFVSDVGGFLNIVTLTFAILFPFSNSFIRPRLFLVLYVSRMLFGAQKAQQLEREIQQQQEKEDANAAAQNSSSSIESRATSASTSMASGMAATHRPALRLSNVDAEVIQATDEIQAGDLVQDSTDPPSRGMMANGQQNMELSTRRSSHAM